MKKKYDIDDTGNGSWKSLNQLRFTAGLAYVNVEVFTLTSREECFKAIVKHQYIVS